jgi:predicted ATP-grasp superfamily ATP-dependent carboligase
MEDLLSAVAGRGLESYVLSSRPQAEHADRLGVLRKQCAWLGSSGSHELSKADVENALSELTEQGRSVRCCICVWEGYRSLMAFANQRLGAADITEEQARLFTDKLQVRQRLRDAGLSQANAVAVSAANLEELKQSGKRLFLKPRRGIASYGAFSLRPDTRWEQLQRILAEAEQDIIYRSVIDDSTGFVAEDYIPGVECSFEIICHAGKPYVVAAHEKLEVTETASTTLEDCCVSPPLNIEGEAMTSGIDWITRAFAALDLKSGCYHVEARCHEGFWDLIEINPRVGGSLISASVGAITGGRSMLQLWLDALLEQTSGNGSSFADRLARLCAPHASAPARNGTATFFRVYFARPGTIERVEVQQMDRNPAVTHILLKQGDRITESAREVFLAQMLWTMDLSERDDVLGSLINDSKHAIKITYEASSDSRLQSVACE